MGGAGEGDPDPRGGPMFHLIPLLVLTFVLTACGGDPLPNVDDGGSPDITAPADARGDTSVPPDGGTPPDPGAVCMTDRACDDGNPCTAERCSTPGDLLRARCEVTVNEMACPAGQVCDPRRGCSAGRACAADGDCRDDDPCTVMERCDPASRTCRHSTLDGDRDGYAPTSCGGRDCDDNDPERRPGVRDRCNRMDDNCNGQIDEGMNLCGRGMSCQAGQCLCALVPASQMRRGEIQFCGDNRSPSQNVCTDVRTDNENCGELCEPCLSGSTCQAGRCVCGDPARTYCSDRSCSDLRTDLRHCGSCGTSCPTNATACLNGVCQCPAGMPLCAPMGLNECFDPSRHQDDDQNCGACGNACPAESHCVGGRCVCTSPGSVVCAGACNAFLRDTMNCGSCGNRCEEGLDCRLGLCGCFDETTRCPTGCRHLQDDPQNCGACGRVCPMRQNGSAPYCVGGLCMCVFQSGAPLQVWCSTPTGEQCADLERNPEHCGGCGRACRSGTSCVRGECI